jgi:hypothetical protein
MMRTHSSKIKVENAPGQSSAFSLVLPLTRPPGDLRSREASTVPPADTAPAGAPK